MNQLQLVLPEPRARRTDPETSHAAAAAAGPVQAAHAARILEALRAGPGTIYEIGERCGLSHVQVARTIAQLGKPEVRAARVLRDEAGYPVKRAAPTGRMCRVWRLP